MTQPTVRTSTTRPTGPRSLTERRRPRLAIARPRSLPGRERIVAAVLAVGVLASVFLDVAPARAQSEILAWLRRGLLPVRLEPGEWARYALEEISESRVLRDTLTVTVVGLDAQRRWLEFSVEGRNEVEYFLVDPEKFGPEGDVLDGVDRLVRKLPGDQWAEEDLDEYRQDKLVRRNLEDPFVEPSVLREALPDTVIAGEKIARQRIRLTERREERRPLGKTELVIETRVEAEAETSEQVPLLGILRSSLRTLVQTRTEPSKGRSEVPPQEMIRSLECIASGREEAVQMPSFGGL